MYTPAVCSSLIFISLLVLSIFLKSTNHHKLIYKIRTYLIICLTISCLASVAPQTAQIGAPFNKYGQPKIAFFGCNYQISLTTARFCSEDKSFEWCYCNNFNAFATIAHCYRVGHEKEIDSLLDMCKEYSNKTLTKDIFEKADHYYNNRAKTIDEIPNYQPYELVDYPIKLNESEIHIFESAYEQFLGNYDRSIDYGFYLIAYWIIVFALVSVGNWSKVLLPRLQPTDSLTNWFRKNISLPATGYKNKTSELPLFKIFDMLVPTRAESLILATFGGLCLYYMTVDIYYTPGNPLFSNKYTALLKYYAVRASLLSSSLMPLLILFGGRNNILQYITRWDYATFITLHRWVSRIIIFMILIHALFYTIYLKDRGLPEESIPLYIWFGVAAIYAGVVILVQGLLILRRKCYEVFLLLHIVLAAVFIFGAWLHVEDLYCVWFYYTSAVVWAFDRIIRLLRMTEFGFPIAKVYLLSDETLKIIIPKPKNWQAIPGGHAFIHFLKPSCFWQSHPFTYTVDDESNIILFIKVKRGVTRQISNYLMTHKDRYTTIRVAIEGSYGESTPASKYNTAVFFAGGNGIPGIFAEAYELLKYENKQSIKLYWVVREYKSLLWFYKELMALKGTKIETTIFITRPNSSIEERDFNSRTFTSLLDDESSPLNPKQHTIYDSIKSDGNIIKDIQKELSHIKLIESRPNIKKIVETNINESMGSTCFVTCGAPSMVDDIRHSVVLNLDYDRNKRVDYFEQLQVWA
ncbi:unnamed protein product [Candida verbasci]|uniref:FAD-binding FR-type domain-containing protein n=1 Tax=Candida verbasci TaxID=1227364 RepID=A0A9W4XJY8_9ASCO|nr:unnamed protein product [Candida verbasci]